MDKKKLLLFVSVILIGAMSVAGTVAYFTDTDADTNTFTVGQVGLTLDEAPVDENGKETTGNRVQKNNYKLIPGFAYDKDPTVHIDSDSSNAWIFVKVVNEIATIEGDPTVASQMADKGWTLVSGETDVYAYKDIVSAGADILVFESFTIKGDGVDGDVLETYKDKTITVIGYAVQADGFGTAAEAWAAYVEQNG